MEESTWCPSCRAATMHFDLVDCTSVCERCGCVQEESPLVSGEYGGGQRVEDDTGAATAWRLLDSSQAGRLVRQEAFKMQSAGRPHAMRRVADLSDRVRLPVIYRTDVEALVDDVLKGEWGQGRWLDVLVAACVYIVVRQRRLALTVADVASAVQSSPVELGATYRRVLQVLEIQPPEADPMAFIRSAASQMDSLRGRHRARLALVLESAELLLKCAQRASLLTGRRPLPLAAAILYQAAEAHNVKLTLDQVALTLGAGSKTALTRLRELRAALAVEGQKLPWGADVTETSVKDHLPMILQLLRFSDGADSQDNAPPVEGRRLEVLREGAGPGKSLVRGGGTVKLLTGRPSSAVCAGARESTVGPGTRGFETSQSLEGAGNYQKGGGSKTGAGPKKGMGREEKRARNSNSRPGTAEGMYTGPLGSYLQQKKARNESTDGAAAEGGGATVGVDVQKSDMPGQINNASRTANGTVLKDTAVKAKRVQIGAGSNVNSVQQNASEHSARRSVGVDEMEGINTPEPTAEPEGVNASKDIASRRDQLTLLSSTGKETQTSASSAEIVVRPVETELKGPELGESSTGGEAVPSFDTWHGLPPSFRAQAVERQRRATLIADVKKRLAGLQAHLGVSGGSHAAPPLPPLPKYQARPPEQVLLTSKRKRNGVEDLEWEARTIEALLIRGADEQLLLEGQYERARQQLEAARPRAAGEDEDVTEYIRTDAEIRALQAADIFVARISRKS